MGIRFYGPGKPYHGLVKITMGKPKWTGEGLTVPHIIAEPLSWKDERVVFVDSMSDLFFEKFTDEEIAVVFGVMAVTSPRYLSLTKRSERMRRWFQRIADPAPLQGEVAGVIQWKLHLIALRCALMAGRYLKAAGFAKEGAQVVERALEMEDRQRLRWPLPNVGIGVSVESQPYVKRVDDLVQIPAAMRFISQEPMLERVTYGVDFEDATGNRFGAWTCPKCKGWGELSTGRLDVNGNDNGSQCDHCNGAGCAVDLVIFGGESGPDARPCDVDGILSGIEECRKAGVSPFVKQLGARPLGLRKEICDACASGLNVPKKKHGLDCPGGRVLKHRKGGNIEEWPRELRVQEMPDGWIPLWIGKEKEECHA
jgi:protein gp37